MTCPQIYERHDGSTVGCTTPESAHDRIRLRDGRVIVWHANEDAGVTLWYTEPEAVA